jgi:hypothetical protein
MLVLEVLGGALVCSFPTMGALPTKGSKMLVSNPDGNSCWVTAVKLKASMQTSLVCIRISRDSAQDMKIVTGATVSYH